MAEKPTLKSFMEAALRNRRSDMSKHMQSAMEEADRVSAGLVALLAEARGEGLRVTFRNDPPTREISSPIGVLVVPHIDRCGAVVKITYEVNFGGYGSEFYAYPQESRSFGQLPLSAEGRYQSKIAWREVEMFVQLLRRDLVEVLLRKTPIPAEVTFPKARVF